MTRFIGASPRTCRTSGGTALPRDFATSPRDATGVSVQPGSPRRYCLIDGQDSLRLLMAYGKLDRALELSNGSK